MDQVLKTMIENMPAKTGKSLDEWKIILRVKAFEKHMEGVKFLKTEYDVTHGFANTIVTLAKDKNEHTEDLVEEQYQGKEELKSIYNTLIAVIKEFGKDVVVSPKKASVSIIRKRQFALIKPATKTRIDLGLKLVGKEINQRLENSGPFGTMCTHRVQLSNVNQVDNELVAWLKEAYEMSK